MSTRADPGGRGWAIDDAVLDLRVHGTDTVYPLAGRSEWTLGASADCSLQLQDPSERLSRRHAQLALEGSTWMVRDLDSTNGTFQDGARRTTFALAPGVELGVGGITLIAQSARLVALRDYLARIIGWRRGAHVDAALRACRHAASGHASLVLSGDGRLAPIAERLHRLALEPTVPFVVYEDGPGIAAYDRAASGTLCLIAGSLPPDLELVIAASKVPDARVHLVLCGDNASGMARTIAMLGPTAPIAIPPIGERATEIDRLILESAADAAVRLEVDGTGFRANELEWLRRIEYRSHEEIDDAMMHVVALRMLGSRQGAKRLGIHHANLLRWAQRRRIPT